MRNPLKRPPSDLPETNQMQEPLKKISVDTPTILVVEDEANIRKLVSVNLSGRGYSVFEASDSMQAMAHLRTISPDLMILDIKLPDLTGWELLERIELDAALSSNFPVLVMTASIMDAHVDLRKFPRVTEILIKPFSAPVLIAAVQRALHRKQR
jgi:CheY-like chemotaxis protein